MNSLKMSMEPELHGSRIHACLLRGLPCIGT